MEEKFQLKESRFKGFLFRYAPIQIFGSIALTFIDKFIQVEIIDALLSAVLFISAIVWGVLPLKNLNRQLLITDKTIVVMKNGKKPVVAQQIAVDKVNKVTEYPNGDYIFEYNNGEAEVISLTYAINPQKEQVFRVNAAFERIFGDKFIMQDKSEIKKYLETNVLPEYIAKEDQNTKSQVTVSMVLYIIFGIIPTLLGVLQTIHIILLILLLILKPFTA